MIMNNTTRDTYIHRHTSRKNAAEEEIELRRNRGELSCAECKRLKLKCDKKVPCGACLRRGCQSLCPHGSLANGGTRYNLSDTEELKRARGELSCVECKRLKLKCDKKIPCGACVRRGCQASCPHGDAPNREESRSASYNPTDTEEHLRQISEMSHRIHLLEDALALLQSSISSEKHYLLRDDMLSIKYGSEQPRSVEPDPPKNSLAETVEAFGTMTIGDSGESRYFGASAGSEVCPPFLHLKMTRLKLLNNLAAMFPVGSGCPTGPETAEIAINMLLSCLPSRPRAWSLCETFLEQASWLFQLVQREELIQDILNPVYMAKQERENSDYLVATEISPHKISVLYSIFALGCLVDLTIPAMADEGDRYHHCARAALALRSIFDSPMVETVQAILVMSSYCSISTQRYSRESVWMLSSLGCKVAQSVNRDPARWNMDLATAERRRILFWEMYSVDMHHSLALGRPPAIGLSYVDCALPQAGSDSDPEGQFWKWKYEFNKNIFGSVLELTIGAKSPDYKTILELDRKVREMPLPPALNFYLGREGDGDASMNIHFKGGYLAMVRTITMLYIHKTYFARALVDHPTNPLCSPYATSFLAATRCASSVIRSSAQYIKDCPEFYTRWWTMWAQLFSAAMMTGLVVMRAPTSIFAPQAFSELIIAVKLFENGAKVLPRVRTGMDILHRVQDKALLLFAQHRNGAEPPTESLRISPEQDGNADELAIFSGQNRRLISRMLSQKVPLAAHDAPVAANLSSDPPVTFHSPPSVSSQSSQSSANLGMMEMPDVHPSLMEYISSVPQAGTVPGFMNHEASTNSFYASHDQPLPTRTPTDLPSEKAPYPAPSTAFPHDSTSVDHLRQLYAETLATHAWDLDNIGEPGAALNNANGIDEDWVMFLKESGL
ncbi:hypothetical protein FIBSPDRAFT_923431 [Athelia psychrophila]|uniref:Zn(2)-C6 fungal-type domain-containing protein n=1 Tax=Athelia psychrophila TaxID=1759441 RepID=A0A167ULK7_9AGAM|nr:hypothetical protein FIBSPDRAFT_923431 [Fibularhizoctonia sp. CBS 109695]